MTNIRFLLKHFRKVSLVIALFLCLFLSSIIHVSAAPTGDIHDESSGPADGMYLVDLKATVPNNFTGMVFVLLSHESGDYYTIRCDKLSGYESSAELPKGRYVVESAYTSEDSLVFEAFLDTEGFVLGDHVQTLAVTVKYHAEGAAFDPTGDRSTPDNSSNNPKSTESLDTSSEADVPVNQEHPDKEGSNLDHSSDIGREEVPQEEPSLLMSIGAVVKSFVTFLAGSAVFAGIIFILVYIVRRRLNN